MSEIFVTIEDSQPINVQLADVVQISQVGTVGILEVQAGTDISVDNSDAVRPIVNSTVDTSGIGTNTTAISNHVTDLNNPHSVTKAQVGLSNVPNTDLTSAVNANTAKTGITTTQANNITTNNSKISYTDKTKVAGIETGAQKNVPETDPIFNASQAKNITAGHISTLGNTSGTNTGDQVGDGSTITGTGTALDPFVSAGGGGSTAVTGYYRDGSMHALLGFNGTRQGNSTQITGFLANFAYSWPIRIIEDIGITAINMGYIQVAGAAGAKVRIGVYDSVESVPVGSPLVDSGDIDCDAMAYKTATFSKVNLTGNKIYSVVLIVNDPTIKWRYFAGGGPTDAGPWVTLGAHSSISTQATVMRANQTYGAMPSTFGSAFITDILVPPTYGFTLAR